MSNEPVPAQKPKGRGCFFYGCLTLVILLLIAGVAGYFAVRYAVNKVNQMVEQFTDASPAALPAVQMSSEKLEAIKNRVEEFKKSLDAGQSAQTLVLTAEEINGMIANDPAYKDFKDRLFVSIEDDKIRGQVSLPLDAFAEIPLLSKLKGRYLNGEATLKVALENGVLVVTLDSLQVKGQSLPPEAQAELRKQNLAKDLYSDPKSAETIAKFENITVKDGRITIKTRVKQ